MAITQQILNKSTHKHPGSQQNMLTNIPIKLQGLGQILFEVRATQKRTDGRMDGR
jgi:hypothetical protein